MAWDKKRGWYLDGLWFRQGPEHYVRDWMSSDRERGYFCLFFFKYLTNRNAVLFYHAVPCHKDRQFIFRKYLNDTDLYLSLH